MVENYQIQYIAEGEDEPFRVKNAKFPRNLHLTARTNFHLRLEKCNKLDLLLDGVLNRICSNYLHFNSYLLSIKDVNGNRKRPTVDDIGKLIGREESMTRRYLKCLTEKKALIKVKRKYLVNPTFVLKGRFIPIEEAVILFHNDQSFLSMITNNHRNQLYHYIHKNKIYMEPGG